MSIDLAAVCRAHGIITHDHSRFNKPEHAWYASCAFMADEAASGPTEADAVCALLKARYQMTTDRNDWRRWYAWTDMHCTEQDHTTELAAVVALADRLRPHTTHTEP